MRSWTASDTGKVEEIKIALLQLEKEHSIFLVRKCNG